MTSGEHFISYTVDEISEQNQIKTAHEFYLRMNKRRTIRDFSDRTVNLDVIKDIIHTANTAPSGAHKQPWHFAVVSSPEKKQEIRKAAEAEEYENYHSRMSDKWLKDLEIFNTDWNKHFLETAPYLIVVFRKPYDLDSEGNKLKNYYVNESVGIAVGFLLAAIHNAGLAALTHTPSPMDFLGKILGRPENEKPYLLIPVGYPAEDAMVPDIERKPLNDIASFS